ncbi:hypothetical protein RHMOL_Rhmol05G0164300 [Rhododendron molle]|uniref:Uncharacterized protein n=1 Tax=Rhododendron molle TaxID=49168 RepID=A0ACC0NRC1_RHOML|nr:hypothetical protein RHMOL_Rhmol05G0164300 [Rhododendron molle]
MICKHGYELDLFVATALVDMYAKCGDMSLADNVFDEMPERNLVPWNCMIVGFLQNEIYDRAVGFFKGIMGEMLSPDQVSFSSVLSACANIGVADSGKQVHGVAVKHGVISLAYVKNSLMDMYFKCGSSSDGTKLFKTIGDKDVVTLHSHEHPEMKIETDNETRAEMNQERSKVISIEECRKTRAEMVRAFLSDQSKSSTSKVPQPVQKLKQIAESSKALKPQSKQYQLRERQGPKIK